MGDSPGLQNDPSVPDAEMLFRGINENHLNPDGTITSAAFRSTTNPHVSVDRSALSTPQESLARRPHDIGLAKIRTGTVRQFTPGVAYNPLPENRAHALIIHDFTLSNRRWKEVARSLARSCMWAVEPRPRPGAGTRVTA